MNLENEKTKQAYESWKNAFPQSLHDLDTDRFDEFVLLLLESNDLISETELEQAFDNNIEERIIDVYSTRFSTLTDMYRLMINSGYAKQ